jgi:hypothetical protein
MTFVFFMSNPQTIGGRPIQEAYFFCFSSGIAVSMATASFLATVYYRKARMDISTLLMHATHLFGILFVGVTYFNLAYPQACVLIVVSSIAYSLCDAAVDSYLFAIIHAIAKTNNNRMVVYGWWIFFAVGEFGTRILNFAFIGFISAGVLCRPLVNVEVSIGTTMFKAFFVGCMGVYMVLVLLQFKETSIQKIGRKTILSSIFLVVMKLALFLPYCIAF